MAELNVDKMAKTVAERAMKELRDDGVFVAKWIPVSEGLPEEETSVLICNRQGEIEIAQGSIFDNGAWEWYTSGWRYGEVIAWTPLPDPYKEGVSE